MTRPGPWAFVLALAASTASHDIARAEPDAIELRVTCKHRDGTPVKDARITVLGPDAGDGPPFAFLSTQEGGAGGKATFQVPRAGRYDLEVLAPGHRSVSSKVDVNDPRFGANFEISWAPAPVAAITVRVRGPNGEAVVGARVRIDRPRTEDDQVRPHEHDATTDASGNAVLHVQEPQRWTVRVRHSDHDPAQVPLVVGDDLAAQGIDVSLVARVPSETVQVGPDGRREGAPIDGPPSPPGPPTPPRPPAPPQPPQPPQPPAGENAADFGGRWRHTSGTTLELKQSGASVTGTWSHLASRLEGNVKGRTLTFTTTSEQGLVCQGEVTLDATGRAWLGTARVTRSATDTGRVFHFDAERQP